MYSHYNMLLSSLLNQAEGLILDDEKLVNALQSSKATAIEVKEQLEVSVKNEERIDITREVQNTL